MTVDDDLIAHRPREPWNTRGAYFGLLLVATFLAWADEKRMTWPDEGREEFVLLYRFLTLIVAGLAVLLVTGLAQRAYIAFGWVVAVLLTGACAGYGLPWCKYTPARLLAGAEFAFWFAVIGAGVGTIVSLSANRFRFRILHLIEFTMASALIMCLWKFLSDAQKWVQQLE
jgi:hypothetical protein